jgi:hypothetical protein
MSKFFTERTESGNPEAAKESGKDGSSVTTATEQEVATTSTPAPASPDASQSGAAAPAASQTSSTSKVDEIKAPEAAGTQAASPSVNTTPPTAGQDAKGGASKGGEKKRKEGKGVLDLLRSFFLGDDDKEDEPKENQASAGPGGMLGGLFSAIFGLITAALRFATSCIKHVNDTMDAGFKAIKGMFKESAGNENAGARGEKPAGLEGADAETPSQQNPEAKATAVSAQQDSQVSGAAQNEAATVAPTQSTNPLSASAAAPRNEAAKPSEPATPTQSSNPVADAAAPKAPDASAAAPGQSSQESPAAGATAAASEKKHDVTAGVKVAEKGKEEKDVMAKVTVEGLSDKQAGEMETAAENKRSMLGELKMFSEELKSKKPKEASAEGEERGPSHEIRDVAQDVAKALKNNGGGLSEVGGKLADTATSAELPSVSTGKGRGRE